MTDQSDKKQGRRLGVGIIAYDRKTVSLVGKRVIGITAVDLIAGEARAISQILTAGPAKPAGPAAMAQPWDADALADCQSLDPLALGGDDADDFVAGNQRQTGRGQFAVEGMQISPADAACANPDQHLIRRRIRYCSFGGTKRLSRPIEEHCAHRSGPFPRGAIPLQSISIAPDFRAVVSVLAALAAELG